MRRIYTHDRRWTMDDNSYRSSSIVYRLHPADHVTPERDTGLEQRAIALLLVLLFLASLGAGAVAAMMVKSWTPNLHISLFGPTPKGYWYLSRASGVVAYA